MKTIVVVDDERVFEFDALYLRTLREALSWFGDYYEAPLPPRVHELWLDHDLGGSDEDPVDVRPLIAKIEKTAYEGTPYEIDTIIVCTDNPVGRSYIHAALDRHYHVIDIPVDVKWKILGRKP